MSRSNPVVSTILLALSLAILTNFISNNLGSRFIHQPETVEAQHDVLAGKPIPIDGEPTMIPQFYNRILFPSLFWLVSRLGIFGDAQSYLLVRFFSALALFLTFLAVISRLFRADIRISMVGAGLLMYAYLFTFNHGWEVTSDYFDGVFTCLFLLFALERKRAALFAIVILASFNRESAVFSGVVWFVLYGVSRTRQIQWGETLYAAFLCFTSSFVVIGIRLAVLGRRDTFGGDSQVVMTPALWWKNEFSPVLHHPTLSIWPVLACALLTPIIWWIWVNREYIRETQARLLIAAGLIGCITCFFGRLNELRVFIPALVVLIFTCVWLEVLRSQIRTAAPGEPALMRP